VNRVTDTVTGEEFALKKITIQSNEVQRLVKQEIDVWKRVNGHPNIVRFIEASVDKANNCVYILSELCS